MLRVESCSGAKESWEVDRKQRSPEKWIAWVKKLPLELNFSNIYWLVPFDLGP